MSECIENIKYILHSFHQTNYKIDTVICKCLNNALMFGHMIYKRFQAYPHKTSTKTFTVVFIQLNMTVTTN